MRAGYLVVMAVTAMVFGGAGEVAAAPEQANTGQANAGPSNAGLGVAPVGPLGPLAELAVRRILLGDLVAAAKFGTTQPIDDPVREKQVLDEVAEESVRLGMAPAPNVRFFQAQIEASKLVQRGLFSRWERYPSERPTRRPDLAKEVRPRLDLLTTQLLDQLRATLDLRRPTVICGVRRIEAEVSADVVHRLDKLHRDAVSVSLRPVCSR